jgi:hypothetical protein
MRVNLSGSISLQSLAIPAPRVPKKVCSVEATTSDSLSPAPAGTESTTFASRRFGSDFRTAAIHAGISGQDEVSVSTS